MSAPAGVEAAPAAAAGAETADRAGLYEQRAGTFAAAEAAAARRYDRISLVRLGVFVGGALAVVGAAEQLGFWPALAAFVLSVALFAWLVGVHERILQAREHLRRLRLVNERSRSRLEGRLDGFDTGEEFRQASHAYAADLDVFGRHSMFQALSCAHTLPGRERLASWLSGPAAVDEVRARQEAVRELAGRLEFRQQLEARALRIAELRGEGRRAGTDDPGAFAASLAERPVLTQRRGLRLAVRVLPVLTVGLFVLSLATGLPPVLPVLLVLGQMGLNAAYEKHVARAHAGTSRQARLLAAYVEMLATAEAEPLEGGRLAAVRAALLAGDLPASRWIGRLTGIVHLLDLRYGMMHFPINSLLLWDLNALLRLERWRSRAGAAVGGWFSELGELEALASLAAALFERPDWTLPALLDEAEPRVEGRGIGHPLIRPQRLVRNDFALCGAGAIAIVSGSNMAGKSTFLRSVGVNVLLALAGGPVCAASFRLSPVRLYTSMRTEDDLGEGASLFYAELRRLKQTLDAVAAGERVFFLLDEVLKGTNSRDRHAGTEALLRQLHRHGAAGLVATHDLELGHLEDELPRAVQNYCFESQLVDGRLSFDYRLRPGIATSMNAVELMRGMGIEV